jgi:cyclopropane fatty-acyl-phospholipid synthase-like methyltransferase
MPVNERFQWSLQVLEIQPADLVLEIGCGTGMLAEMIAKQLHSGHLTALDQSAAMINQASNRLQSFIQYGKATCLLSSLAEAPLAQSGFDKILAFNVSAFWKSPAPELEVVRSHLKPEGLFFLFHQPPTETTQQVCDRASEVLQQHHFRIQRTLIQEMKPASAFCLIAQPDCTT